MRTTLAVVVLLLLPACTVEDEGDAAAAPEAPSAQAQPGTQPAPDTPEGKIQNALSAAPEGLRGAATVMDWPAAEGAEMTELRPGTNGWTCMPDVPSTPGNDPMCLDGTFMEWAGAWQSHGTPQLSGLGLSYMLVGGTDASNSDPYATAPAGGEEWVRSGPHVMIVVPDVALLEGIPTDPDNGGPFVMWKGTPYAHVMMPVAEAGGAH